MEDLVKKPKKMEVRYSQNPFLTEQSIKIKDKKVFVKKLNDNTWINQSTGQVAGTHMVTHKKVDPDKFVKLFSQNIALTLGLTTAGLKAFNVLIDIVQNNAFGKDIVSISLNDLHYFNSKNGITIADQTFYRGLRELEKSKIIAKYTTKGIYFLNPHFVFNGDRIAFTTILERKTAEELRAEKQPSLFD